MTKVSFTRHWGQGEQARWELERARSDYKFLELPDTGEFIDGQHDDVFHDAITRLGLEDAEVTFEDGSMQLKPPEGHMFRILGAFGYGSIGNYSEWSYGRPGCSFTAWQHQRQHKKDEYMRAGYTDEDTETLLGFDGWEEEQAPSTEFLNGGSIRLSFGGQTWGRLKYVDPQKEERRSSDNKPKTVNVTLDGFRVRWHEQARRFIKLPKGGNDRLVRLHEYGEPGVIECWQSDSAEGSIDDIQVEIVPIEPDVGDQYLPVMQRLWVPEQLRWSLFKAYPDLIDQGMDYYNRVGTGFAIRALGGIASAFAGRDENAFDRIAAQGSLMVLDDPMFAQINVTRLAELTEQMIQTLNAEQPGDAEQRLHDKDVEKDRRRYQRKLVVVTELTQNIHEIAQEYGESNDWFEGYLQFMNGRF